jgi:hypothetical protein
MALKISSKAFLVEVGMNIFFQNLQISVGQ